MAEPRHTTNRAVADHYNLSFAPQSVSTQPKPVPDVLYWTPALTENSDVLREIWEQYLEMGANSLPLCNHSYAAVQESDMVAHEWLRSFPERYLGIRDELGYPIQMGLSFGYNYYWGGDNAPTLYQRIGENMFDPSHIPVYHTTIADAVGSGSLKDLADLYFPGVAYRDAVRYIHCPGYRGATYQAALDKLEAAVQLYEPCAVHFDNEFYTSADSSDYNTEKMVGWAPSTGSPYNGIEACSRCQSAAGYVTNIDQIGSDLSAIIRAHEPSALIAQFYVFDTNGRDRYTMPYWAYGPTTGFTTPNYALYTVTYDPNTPVGARALFTDPVARYDDLVDQGPGASTWTSPYWEGAPVGAYPYLTQRMDAYDYTQGYMTPQMMYDICYHLASKGAKGAAIWPGYSGMDKDPVTYPPGSVSYPASSVADDAAALILIPAMHQAFHDYRTR